MFDRSLAIIQQPGATEYVTKEVNITENRAPTDESVRLLSEMEKAAQAKMERSIRLEANGFKCVVYTSRDLMSQDFVAVALFELNGQQMRSEHRVQEFNTGDIRGAQAFMDGLLDEIAKTIAREAITPLLNSMRGKLY